MQRSSFWLTALLAGLGSASTSAQSSGFSPGEILHYSPIVHGTGSSAGDGAILRLDPLTGQVSIVHDLTTAQFRPGSMCFDAFRDRVLFYGNPAGVGAQFMRLYELDGSGNVTDLGFENERLYLFAPGAGGKIYMHDEASGSGFVAFRYLDANNVRHDLLDASGTAPFDAPGVVYTTALAYDPSLNALLVATKSNTGVIACAGGSDLNLTVLRLDLSADGTRVVSSTCTQAAPDPNGSNLPVGWSRMPDGNWLLAVDTNSNAQQARLLRVAPASLAISTYAINGPYIGAAVTDSACFSSLRGEALLFDDFEGKLLSFAPLGGGSVLATSMPMTFPNYYGTDMTTLEVPSASGGSTVGFYCTAKTNSKGCVPALSTSGFATQSGCGTQVFNLTASNLIGAKNGQWYYST
ncbi:MAG: hypothetical protein K8S98_10535, partial [Planctomycetes bacterium]|nr:hypothetical protein [Planctomycetota bacterium]